MDSKSVDRNLPVVLIVDDRDENLFAFEIAIRPLSCQSVKCHSGREALDYLATHEVAVILLDVQMPEMSGLEVAAIIRERENSKSTPILFITAIDRADDHAKQAYKLGAVDFIYKPADPYALRAKVGFFVELFRKTKELEDKSHLLESSAEAEKTFILEHALDAVIATDSDNRVTFWNEHAQRLFGWTKSEIMGVDMVDVIIPKEYRDRHRDGVRRFLTTGVPKIQHRRIEIPGLRKNGEQFLMELTVSSVNGPSGMRFYSFLRDITTQRLAQKQIVDSERTLEQIFSESYSWMSLLSVPDFRFLRSNAQHEKLFGKTDYIGKTLLEVEPEFEAQGVMDRLRKVALTGEPFVGVEVPMSYAGTDGNQGATRYVDLKYQPLKDEDGNVHAILAQGYDVTDKVLGRRQIEDRERELQTLANSIPQLAWMAEADGSIFWYNDRWYEYTGTTPDQMVGWGWQAVHSPELVEEARAFYEASIKEARPASKEFLLKSKTGEYRWFLTNWLPLKDSSGHVIRWFGTNTDIHEEKRHWRDQEYRADLVGNLNAKSDFKSLVAVATKSVADYLSASRCFVTEVDGVNAHVHAGFSSEGTSHEGFYDLTKYGPLTLKAWRSGSVVKVNDVRTDERTKAYAGEHLSVGIGSFITVPIVREGRLVGAFNVADAGPREWTKRELDLFATVADSVWAGIDRVRLLDALRMTSLRSEFLAKASQVLSSSLDVMKVLTSLSDLTVPEFADWCSIRMMSLNGEFKQVSVSHKDPEKVKWGWELQTKFPPDPNSPTGPYEVMRTGNAQIVNDISEDLIRKSVQNEEQRGLILSLGFHAYICVPLVTRDKVVGTLTLVTTAESGRRFTEEDLQLAKELGVRAGLAVENARLYHEAQSINRLKDEFLANLSHELRTPMNVIQGHAEILEYDIARMNQKDILNSVEAISRNARTQMGIINDLLDVSSIITGKVLLRPEKFDPATTFQSIVESILPTAQGKGVRVHFDATKAPKTVVADLVRVHQIVWNLLSNAIKFTQSGGDVHLTVEADSSSWSMTVTDNGKGIAPDFLPFVFDRFRQEDASTTRNYGGLGLGLSIVRHLVELQGGHARVESAGIGLGAKFVVTFPLELQSVTAGDEVGIFARSEAPATSSATVGEGVLKDVRVLLVDDSSDNRDLMKRFLAKSGARVVEADSAEAARAELQKSRPDVIVSDIGMPGENGMEFIQKLRASGEASIASVPAIALTAYVRDEERLAMLKAGFQDHVGKPVTAAQLTAAIQKLVEAAPHSS